MGIEYYRQMHCKTQLSRILFSMYRQFCIPLQAFGMQEKEESDYESQEKDWKDQTYPTPKGKN